MYVVARSPLTLAGTNDSFTHSQPNIIVHLHILCTCVFVYMYLGFHFVEKCDILRVEKEVTKGVVVFGVLYIPSDMMNLSHLMCVH